MDYLLELKKSGVVRHIGLSSHTPEVIQKILDDADVDMLMFSINPAYDYHEGDYVIGSVDERSGIYRRCEAENIGITVMKPFSGGQLLNAHSSPFGVALTPYDTTGCRKESIGLMILVTSGGCNPMFRVPVTCGYPAERGYFVSKKAFLSTSQP